MTNRLVDPYTFSLDLRTFSLEHFSKFLRYLRFYGYWCSPLSCYIIIYNNEEIEEALKRLQTQLNGAMTDGERCEFSDIIQLPDYWYEPRWVEKDGKKIEKRIPLPSFKASVRYTKPSESYCPRPAAPEKIVVDLSGDDQGLALASITTHEVPGDGVTNLPQVTETPPDPPAGDTDELNALIEEEKRAQAARNLLGGP